MLQSRYHRRRQARDNAESEDEVEHSDSSSGSADRAESSGSSVESEAEMSGDDGEIQVDPAAAEEGYQVGRARGTDSWGSPPKVVDEDHSWGAAAKPNADATPSWQEMSASFSTDDAKHTSSNQDDTWGMPDKENTGFGDRPRETWKNRQASDSPRRGRGPAPKPVRGTRGGSRGTRGGSRGTRGGSRGTHSQVSDRPYLPDSTGKPRGGGKPNRGRGGSGAGHSWSNPDSATTSLDKSSVTDSSPQVADSWGSVSQTDIKLDSDATWGAPDSISVQNTPGWNSVPETATKSNDDGWGEPEKVEDETTPGWDSVPETAKKSNDVGWGEPAKVEDETTLGWDAVPETATKSNDDGWGEAAKVEDETKWDQSEATGNWNDESTKLDQYSDKQPSNDGESSPTNEASQRRMNARREYRKKLEEDPSFVPHLGEFWSHDDRFRDEEMKNRNDRGRGGFRGRGRGRGGADVAGRSSPAFSAAIDTHTKWVHDGYESLLRTEDRDEQRRRDRLERLDRQNEDGQGISSDIGFSQQRGRGRGFRGGRGRGTRGGSSGRQSPVIRSSSGPSAEEKLNFQEESSLTAELDALKIQTENDSQCASRKKVIKESSDPAQTDSNNTGNADEDSDVEIILEAPAWRSEQVLGIPTPKSTGSEKSLTGEEAGDASTSHNGFVDNPDNDQVTSPGSNWGKPDPELMDKAATWQQQPEFPTQSNEHQYPIHNMLSPNAVQFVPMTTMGGNPHNMMPMQTMYAVPMNMTGSREGVPGPVMYAPMMNSQQNMFEANGMFYYGYDPSQMSQMPMYTPVMYYPQSSAPPEDDRAYSSPQWSNSRKYTQQERSQGKQSASGHHSQQ